MPMLFSLTLKISTFIILVGRQVALASRKIFPFDCYGQDICVKNVPRMIAVVIK